MPDSPASFYSNPVGLVPVLKADLSRFKLEPMLVSAGVDGRSIAIGYCLSGNKALSSVSTSLK